MSLNDVKNSSPSVVPSAVMTDWVPFDMNITAVPTSPTKGATSTDQGRWRRVGDSIELMYTLNQSTAGVAGSGAYLFHMPPGLKIDLDKVDGEPATASAIVGAGMVFDAALIAEVHVRVQDEDAVALEGSTVTNSGGVGSGFFPLSTPGTIYSFRATLPIQGWKASTVINGASQELRPTDIKYVTATPQSIPHATSTIVNFDTIVRDEKSEVTVGAAWEFEAQESGTYEVDASLLFDSSAAWSTPNIAALDVHVDGVFHSNLNRVTVPTGTQFVHLSGNDDIELLAGQKLHLQVIQQSGVSQILYNVPGFTRVSIQKKVKLNAIAVTPNFYPQQKAVLGTSYDLVAQNTWEDTGLSISLDAGTYDVSYDASMSFTNLPATGGTIFNQAKLFVDSLGSLDDTIQNAGQGVSSGTGNFTLHTTHSGRDEIVLPAPSVLRLYARTSASVPSSFLVKVRGESVSGLITDRDNATVLRAKRLI